MEDFERSSGSVVVVGVEKFGLGDEGLCFEADLLSPADEVGEEGGEEAEAEGGEE